MVRLLPEGIRERLFLLIALALAPALVLQGWVYSRRYATRRNEAMRTEMEVAQGVATTFTSYLNDVRRQLNTTGQAIITFDPYTDAKAAYLLGTVTRQHPTLRNVSWLSPEGLVLASGLPRLVGHDLSGRDYFQQILAGQSWALGDLMPTGNVTESPIFIIASAIHDGRGVFRGVVQAAIEPTRLGEQTFAEERPSDGAYTIFDGRGQLVYRNPETPLTWEQRTRWRRADPLLRQAMDGRVGEGSITSVIGGHRCIAARVPIAGIGWVAGASRPVRVAMGPVRLALIREAGIGLLVTFFAFGAACLIARTIADPLRRLEAEARAMGEGRIGPPAGPDGPKEVHRLHDTITQMATDLIQRAESLRESEQRLQRTQEIAHLGSWELDLTRNKLTWSDEVYRIFGLEPQEFDATYEAFLECVHPDDRRAVDDAYTGSLREGSDTYEIEHRIVRQDTGEVRTVHEKCEHSRDATGKIGRSIGMVHDITESKRAEDSLRESEGRHRRLVENLKRSHFIYRHDTEGVFQYVSESLTDILGYTPDEFMARYDTYLTDHPANQAVHRRTDLTMQGIRQTPWEVNIRHKDGSTRWLEVQETPIFDPEGKVVAVEGVAQDITERTQTEEALRESEERHRFLVESVNDWIWEVDQNGVYTYVGPQCREMLGYEPQEIVGKTPFDLMPPEEAGRVRELFGSIAGQAKPLHRLENVNRRQDGRLVVLETNGVPVLDAQGKLAGYRGVDRDITERKQAEESLRELTATLESRVAQRTAQLERRTRQLQKLALELSQAEERERKRVADILHDDLQQQLAAAKFHLGLLGNRVRDDDSLREATTQVEGMIKDAIAKSRSLSHELSPAVLYHGDFGEAIEWLANQVQAKHGLLVHVEIRGPIEVSSDPVKAFLFRTAQEILFNIVKHAQVAEATVRLRRRRDQLWLAVRDRGRGFDPIILGQAAGFGLLSIRERVELLGGRMRIRSAPGLGSTFLIAVPDGQKTQDRGQKIQNGRDPSAVVSLSSSGSALRVLLADDHKVVREGLATLLNEQEDIEVVGQAANGREAIDLAHELQPDVVVMDVAMPMMDGDEATRQIKQDMPQTRVVGLSMFDEPSLVERMHRAGAERYVVKTAPAGELLAAIRDK